jgi:hypothetical protein
LPDYKETQLSEVRLNIIDGERSVNGTCHGSVADAAVAALSVEPETLAELEAGLGRFIKPFREESRFAAFHAGENFEPWDAGIVILDLAARMVAVDSLYSSPEQLGEVLYHDGTSATDVAVLYYLSDDWLIVYSVDEYKGMRDTRRNERLANPHFDARAVLYGSELTEFIVRECLAQQHSGAGAVRSASTGDEEEFEESDPVVAAIHAKWLMTPREDLRGASPRHLILARQKPIDLDLQYRGSQWTFVGEAPPYLSRNSHAYRFGGFGTNEWVIYYELVRHLIRSCMERISGDQMIDATDEAARLDQLKTDWLEQPNENFGGRIPAFIVEYTRRRMPLTLSAKDMILVDDCPTCQPMGNGLGMGPAGFWFLDSANMDDYFPFSHFLTREEWEADKRKWAEFNEQFEREWAEREKARANESPDPYGEASELIQ